MKEYLEKINTNDNNIDQIKESSSQDFSDSHLHTLLIEEINLLKQYVNDVSDILRLILKILHLTIIIFKRNQLNVRCEDLQNEILNMNNQINNSRHELYLENKTIQDSQIKLNGILQIEDELPRAFCLWFVSSHVLSRLSRRFHSLLRPC